MARLRHGDPLKDAAGRPALNPLIKVMNMVALISIPLIIRLEPNSLVFWGAMVVAVALLYMVTKKPRTSKEELEILQRAE